MLDSLSTVSGFFPLDWASQFSEVVDTGRLLDLRVGGSIIVAAALS
jgi:hypothetical protein